MRRPHPGKKLAARNAVGAGISATLRMPTAPAARSSCTQALMVEALPQKSRAGGFPPPLVVIFSQRKFLYKPQPFHVQHNGRQVGEASPAEINCL
jgi:hypothetical protein